MENYVKCHKIFKVLVAIIWNKESWKYKYWRYTIQLKILNNITYLHLRREILDISIVVFVHLIELSILIIGSFGTQEKIQTFHDVVKEGIITRKRNLIENNPTQMKNKLHVKYKN